MDEKILRKMLEKSFRIDPSKKGSADPGLTYRGNVGPKAYARVFRQLRDQSPSPTGNDVLSGQRSQFTIDERIGRGGMGEVFRAWQSGLEREVAIKRLRKSRDEAEAEAFVAEAMTAGYLDHPNIVPVYDLVNSESGHPGIAMKLVGGTSWSQLLHPVSKINKLRARPYTLERHIEILLSVCNAAAYAHSRGILHRDIKPSNVMVGDFGEVFLMDWGMAVCFRHTKSDTEELRAPFKDSIIEPCGTPSYLAPEMAEARGRDLGPWTDVYLLGATLHEIVTGESPHRGDTIYQIVSCASRSAPPEFDESVPVELQAICRRALARRIDERYQTVTEFRDDLREYLNHRESRLIMRTADKRMTRCIGERLDRRLKTERDRMKAYADLTEAVAGYRQALILWDGNEEAAEKLEESRLAFARAALSTGDFSLAQSQLEGLDGPEARQLLRQVDAAHAERERAERSMKSWRTGAAMAVIVIIVGLAAGMLMVSSEKKRADENARNALANANEAQRLGAVAKVNADEARIAAERAVDAAAKAKELAEERRLAIEQLGEEKQRADENAKRAEAAAELADRKAREAEEALRTARDNERKASAAAEKMRRAQRDARASAKRASIQEDLRTEAERDVQRLADISMVERLTRRARELVTATTPDLAALQTWMNKAKGPLSRFDDHRRDLLEEQLHAAEAFGRGSATLKSLREQDRLLSDLFSKAFHASETVGAERKSLEGEIVKLRGEMRQLHARAARSKEYRFESDEARSRQDLMVELIDCLDAFSSPDEGPVAKVEKKLLEAMQGGPLAAGALEALWKRTLSRIRSQRRYRGVKLAPQVGLIPLGADPASNLQEFLHLPSHNGPIPSRDSRGQVSITADTGLIFVLVPGGKFWMGAQDQKKRLRNYFENAPANESPVHDVELEAFFISKYEMTQGQWQRLMGDNPSQNAGTPLPNGENAGLLHPVESVSWQSCRRLDSQGLALPTEAQWEYAARAGTQTPWWTGREAKKLEKVGNVADASYAALGLDERPTEPWDDGYAEHAPVGRFKPNKFGLHDVSGNVQEWVSDRFGPYDAKWSPGDGRRESKPKARPVLRGGSFLEIATAARTSARRLAVSSFTSVDTGLRPVFPIVDGGSAYGWKRTIDEVSRSARYKRLKITRHDDLVPLGPDPVSGLYEFLHAPSHTGLLPARDDQGALQLTEETGVIFVLVPGGSFSMGAQGASRRKDNFDANALPGESPVKRVDLDAYFISKYEMTQGQWLRLTGKNPAKHIAGTKRDEIPHSLLSPIENVSLNDCRQLARFELRVPTEAQWEYAARAGKTTAWYTGDDVATVQGAGNVSDAAHLRKDPKSKAEEWDDRFSIHALVGHFEANPFGLHDVIGNVWEWCRDGGSYDDEPGPGDGLRQVGVGANRMVRGGCYSDDALDARSAHRLPRAPHYKDPWIGLRPSRALNPR